MEFWAIYDSQTNGCQMVIMSFLTIICLPTLVAKGYNGTLTNYVMANLMDAKGCNGLNQSWSRDKRCFFKVGKSFGMSSWLYTHNARCVPHANMFYFGGFVSLHLKGFSKIVLYFASLKTYIIKENHAYLFRFMYLPTSIPTPLAFWKYGRSIVMSFLKAFIDGYRTTTLKLVPRWKINSD